MLVLAGAHCGPAGPGTAAPKLPSDSLFARAEPLALLPASTEMAFAVERAQLLSADSAAGRVDLGWLGGPLPALRACGLAGWLASADVAASIAADEPAGLAWLDSSAQTAVAFARVADPGRLERALTWLLTDQTVAWQRARGGTAGRIISAPAQGVGLVLRDGWLFIAVSGAASKREAIEVRLASGTGDATGVAAGAAIATSLLSDPGFVRVAGSLPTGSDVVLYLDTDALAQPALARLDDLEQAMAALIEESDEQLRAARERELSPLEERALRDHGKRLRKQLAILRQQAGLKRRVIEQLFVGLGPVSGSIEVTGARAEMMLRAAPSQDTLIASLVAASQKGPLLPARGKTKEEPASQPAIKPATKPLWRLRIARVDPHVLWSVATLISASVWGVPLERVRAGLGEGLEPDARERPLGLPRELGLAVAPVTERVALTLPVAHARARFDQLEQKFGPTRQTAVDSDEPSGALSGAPSRAIAIDIPGTHFEVAQAGDEWTISARPHPPGQAPGKRAQSVDIPPLPADENPDVPLSEKHRELVAEHGSIADRIAARRRQLETERAAERAAMLRALGSFDAALARRRGLLVASVSATLGASDIHALWHRWRELAAAGADREVRVERDIAGLLERAAEIAPELLRVRARDVQRHDLQAPRDTGQNSN